MFSNQNNKWNLGVNSNFENFEFWVVPISKSALVTTTVHQFQKLGLVLCKVLNQEFEFCVQSFLTRPRQPLGRVLVIGSKKQFFD